MKLATRFHEPPGKYNLIEEPALMRGVFAQMEDRPFHLHHDDEDGEDYKISCK